MDEIKEYVTFNYISTSGEIFEMAVIDEFEYDRKEYVVAAKVIKDEIDLNMQFIFRVRKGLEFDVEKIDSSKEYTEIAEAYLKLCEE